jgi:uncharacterized protein
MITDNTLSVGSGSNWGVTASTLSNGGGVVAGPPRRRSSMQHPVVWFEVLGRDDAKLNRFYSELFGWKIDANNPMKYGMVDTGSPKGIPGGIGPAGEKTRPGVTFYVASDDLAASLTRAQELGGRTVLPPTDMKDGPTLALFEDPEGHLIGLVKPRPEQQPAA